MSELLLPFHRDIFTQLSAESGLVVLGEGLGAWSLLKAFVEIYADPKCLVILLGLEPEEEGAMMSRFTGGEHQLTGHVPFNVVKNDTAGLDRLGVYAAGGVVSITSRILVTDMLLERLPFHLCTGIVLYRAERITENGLEAFCLHLLRSHNPDAFIQAISESPEPFTRGFNQLEKAMKWMHLPNAIMLYPRFHSLVKEDLDDVEGGRIDSEELILQPSARTRIVQLALMDLAGALLKDLVKANPFLEADASMDSLLGRQFDLLIRQQLEPIWHQVGFKTRQLVSELSTLRSLLSYMKTQS